MVEKKKKILAIMDHPLSSSGVGTQGRFLINGLVDTGKYSFIVLGAAVKHENHDLIKVNDDFIIKPVDGFGTQDMIRHILATDKPDCILLFTDPRFFLHVWAMEDEIHQICPIAYNHLWDSDPYPKFNSPLYESTDLINCINYPTYEMVHKRFPDKTNYIPHGVPTELYHPLPNNEVRMWRNKLVGTEKNDDFIALFVGRNAKRKMPGDILVSFKMFLDDLQEKYGHKKSTLIMHTNPKDQEGPNLIEVIDMLELQGNVKFSNTIIGFPEMNGVYNAADVIVNRSSAEGFGLPILEAKMAETPGIAIETGGVTRQIKDHETGYEYGVSMPVETRSLVGNQMVPYIYEDLITHKTLAKAFMTMFEKTPEERKEIGKAARLHAIKNYDLKSTISDWDKSLDKLLSTWNKDTHESWRHIEL